MRIVLHYGNELMVFMLFMMIVRFTDQNTKPRDQTQTKTTDRRLTTSSRSHYTVFTHWLSLCYRSYHTQTRTHTHAHAHTHTRTHTCARQGFPVPLHAHGNTRMRYSESPDIKTAARARTSGSLSFILKRCEVREAQLSPHRQYLAFSHNVAW